MALGIIGLCHIIGSILLLPQTLFIFPSGFIFGYYFNGEFNGYAMAFIVMLHINIIAGFCAFLNSTLCFKSLVRYSIKLVIEST